VGLSKTSLSRLQCARRDSAGPQTEGGEEEEEEKQEEQGKKRKKKKAYVYGSSPTAIVGSNSTGGKDVCLLCVVR
jgi:hypothetical protein